MNIIGYVKKFTNQSRLNFVKACFLSEVSRWNGLLRIAQLYAINWWNVTTCCSHGRSRGYYQSSSILVVVEVI